MQWIENSLGRKIPKEIDGRACKPFKGAFVDQGDEFMARRKISLTTAPGRINKIEKNWDALLDKLQLKSGMTVSFHHHLRNGDFIVNETMRRLAERGLKDLVVAPSALFPVHDSLVELIKTGVISHIEGSMNGRVGVACSKGLMKKTAVLRSHGGRYRAIQDGDLHIDVAFIAAPAADEFGNANGVLGKSACGPIGIALADSLYADKVVILTDGLIPFPCVPMSISGLNVDHVLVVDTIGDPEKIVSGTTQITRSPTQLLIAEMAAEFTEAAGIIREGFSFQAGAGGISLAFTKFLGDRIRQKGVKASFAVGGSTRISVELLNAGLVSYIMEGQSFDLEAVRSLRDNPRHVEIDPFISYCQHAKGCFAHMVDVAVLGATEIDLDFNVNVNTHSDGLLLHGIGGFADAAAGAGCTIITAPSFRKRIPIIKDRVTTVTAPGEVIDVIITERGVSINPRREDLIDRVRNSNLPLISLPQLMDEVYTITGKPDEPTFGDRPVALVEWRDGSIIDVVRQVLD